ncbi:CBS domain-containing protein [Nocardioides mangrovicus]|uniref:CBS domain-containing protein n=1 Tax=Nocardioides mangrovicus TaxID=2478913 RepID=A0A3L8P3W7_9ACTN|nr:putative nucleotidyltransferase substrate binding domain-containing protein [Nocardioides mangrovicus]RLV49732.1 CBS domain-containing protein [Nocardioides mangrovicus]
MKEYADFLGTQSPYDALTADDLGRLVEHLQVEYFAAGSLIVRADEPALDHMWVVRTGAVEVVDRGRVVDQLGPGDTFGHISVLTGLPPALSVRALEDSLCLLLPDPRHLVHDPDRLRFSHFGTMISRQRLTGSGALDETPGSARTLMRSLVWSEANETVAEVARRITNAGHSGALVRGGGDASGDWGIVTDADFRRSVATGEVAPHDPIHTMATFPALSVSEEFSQAAAFSRMIDRGVHHLVVLDRHGAPEGILRAVDFASTDIRNPLLVRSQIESATSIDELRCAAKLVRPTLVELGDSSMTAAQVASLLAAIIDGLLRKLVTFHGLDDATSQLSLIVLGSMARREPLPNSDVDTALVWPDHVSDQQQKDLLERVEALLVDMESCGFRRCSNGANAVNPLFARSASSWAAAVTRWLENPAVPQALLLSSIVIDSRPLTEVALGRTVTDTLQRRERQVEFLAAFLREATAVKPPSGFVRDFVVDHRGHHRGQLDLKRGGLLPIAALGRWVAVVTGDTRGGTVDRLRRGHAAGLLTRDEADTLTAAFEQSYELLMKRDLAAIAGGTNPSTYVDPRELDTLTRRHLRETFRATASIQDDIANCWTTRLKL